MSDKYKTIIQQRQPKDVEIFHNVHPDVKPPKMDVDHLYSDHERINDYRSSGELIRSLANTIKQWRNNMPKDAQPVIVAMLNGGLQINVSRLAQESFHGIRIEGSANGNPCMVLTHQNNVELLCYIQQIAEEEHETRIGFVVDGKETEE
ncbi:hypothetical protein [Kangiella sediminilitoris]|uniref:Uncharacterized protein n=1 Tax=Kangiella sediminilitoris TaxID=1144748 RepID=A0A1B3BD99_9GAMM|nr:hypothetical protein [Kangiella sediminilitoris]AOE50770.1 hypothetical protein KS2013_2065 [Kangiella sediminilitoris]